MINLRDFRTLIGPLSHDGHEPWSDERIRAWHSAFRGFPPEVLARSILRMKLTERTWTVEIYDLMRFLAEEAFGVLPDVDQAYAELVKAKGVWYPGCADSCRRAKSMLSEWTAEALDGCGGFREAFHSDNADVFRAQFKRSYERVLGRRLRERLVPGHLKPKSAKAVIPGRPVKAVAAKSPKAIEHQPVSVPVPAVTPESERYAERVAAKFGGGDRAPVRQSEEEADRVKRSQVRKAAAYSRRKKKGG